MRVVLLYGLVLAALLSFVSSAKVQRGYHAKVGIPLAKKMKVCEKNLLTENVNVDDEDYRIAGGSVAAKNDHPYLAGLVIDLTTEGVYSLCGSSLLTANRLVTAGHCWFDGEYQARQFLVILGTNLLYSDGTRITASKVIPHPQYDFKNLNNDIAIIYLANDVEFSDRIQPISLPGPSVLDNEFVGVRATAAGFGQTGDVPEDRAVKVINHVNVEVISIGDCQKVFGTNYARHNILCTKGTGGLGICLGDSGGPLITKQNGSQILIGISSFVVKNGCKLGYPSGFTRVTSHYNFIIKHLQQ